MVSIAACVNWNFLRRGTTATIMTKGRGRVPSGTWLFVLVLLAVSSIALFSKVLSATRPCDTFPTLRIKSTSKSTAAAAVGGEDAESFDLATRESLGFFTDISNRDWRERRAVSRRLSQHNHIHMTQPLKNQDQVPLWYLQNYEPLFSCPRELRVGGLGDGPKWVCDPHRLRNLGKDCLVYSVGSAGKYEFEDAVREHVGPDCEIHTFGRYRVLLSLVVVVVGATASWQRGGTHVSTAMNSVVAALRIILRRPEGFVRYKSTRDHGTTETRSSTFGCSRTATTCPQRSARVDPSRAWILLGCSRKASCDYWFDCISPQLERLGRVETWLHS